LARRPALRHRFDQQPSQCPLDNVPYLFYGARMDWTFAIERHREPLLRIIATLFAMIGLDEGGAIERVSRPLYHAVLGILRPAESAVRRLIIVAARDLAVKPSPKRPAPKGLVISGKGRGRVSFRLFDPPKHFHDGNDRRYAGRKMEPRIRVIDVGFDPRIPLFRQPPPAATALVPEEDDSVEDDTVNAMPLCRRLAAIRRALEDLPREARRFARWRARRIEARRPQLANPLRIGRPPGFRKRQTHEVDEILVECQWLARTVPSADTS
jgi:hypothetical protein